MAKTEKGRKKKKMKIEKNNIIPDLPLYLFLTFLKTE